MASQRKRAKQWSYSYFSSKMCTMHEISFSRSQLTAFIEISEHQATAFFISSFLCESTFRINAVVAVMMIWKTFSKGI